MENEKNSPNFRGVFAIDMLPKKKLEKINQVGIINFQSSNCNGWAGYVT
jgi:hypothetical protein